MQDNEIIELYFSRNENAISETDRKYGRYCHFIAFSILRIEEDSMECVNDTYLRTWNSIPPHKPERLQTFIGKITRNLSLGRYQKIHALKRGGSEIPLILDELSECIGDHGSNPYDAIAFRDTMNRFLDSLDVKSRRLFVRRYWYMNTPSEIAKEYGMTAGNVSVDLHRIRQKLRDMLEKEGITI